VRRVLVEGGRAVGVEALLKDERGRSAGRLVVRARAVCLAGSAVGSAALALASDLPDRQGHVGRHLHLHPSVAVAGVFDRPVRGWAGIPQSIECTSRIDFAPGARDRTWIVPAFAHPIGTASLTPGVGAAHARSMRAYERTAILTAVLHDESEGRVELERSRTRVRYELAPHDREALARGVRACAEILLAAGARTAVVPTSPPLVARSPADLRRFGPADLAPLGVPLVAVHPMGTLRMSRTPAEGVVDADGRHHRVRGLFVCDGSLFPTSIGGPPQISIYALARRVARAVLA
jgi:choline dehydrogenase-like flavoprotein